MVSSVDFKYIFIANPKTGSTTVEHYLRLWDKSFLHNRYVDGDGKIISGIHGHIRPRDLQKIMADKYHHYRVFIFIRNPYDKAVSGYHYYKEGPRKKIEFSKNKGNLNLVFNLILAKILPFPIWSLVKPIKSNYDYLTDDDGNVIVDFIGTTENLSADLKEIACTLGMNPAEDNNIARSNASKREKDFEKYFKRKWHRELFEFLNKRDISLYKKITSQNPSFNWRGTRL